MEEKTSNALEMAEKDTEKSKEKKETEKGQVVLFND